MVCPQSIPQRWQQQQHPAHSKPASTYNVEKLASVKYEFWGGVNFDTVDYFISTLPVANYDSVYLTIRGQNNSQWQWQMDELHLL